MTTYQVGDRVRFEGQQATVTAVDADAPGLLVVRDHSPTRIFVKPSMVELVTPRPQYTDADVERLVEVIQQTKQSGIVHHFDIDAALAPFQTDPDANLRVTINAIRNLNADDSTSRIIAAVREHDAKGGAR